MVITILIIKSYLSLNFLWIEDLLLFRNLNMFPKCIFIFHFNYCPFDCIVPTSFIILRYLNFIFLRELDSNCIAFFINRSTVKIQKCFIGFIVSFVLNESLGTQLSLKHDNFLNGSIFMEYLMQNFNADWVFNVSDCYKQHSPMLIINVHVVCNGISTCEREKYFVWSDSIFILRG